MLLNHKDIDVRQLNNEGQQAIHFHHPGNGYKNLALLLKNGCNPCLQDKSEHKMNVLHRIVSESKKNEYFDNVAMIFDVTDEYDYTKRDILNSLKVKDGAGNKTPMDYAKDAENENNEIEKLLSQFVTHNSNLEMYNK